MPDNGKHEGRLFNREVLVNESPTTDRIRHASLTSLNHSRLCGGVGRITQPGETVNCPACRATLNHLRQQYPARFDYEDIRPTKAQARQAARDMAADMMGGADD